MIADRADFTAAIAKRQGEAGSRILPMARLLAGAAPLMDKLQRTEEWERYCTYLQGIADRFSEQKKVALQKLSDPGITKDEEIRKLRQDIFIADVTISTLKLAVDLPAAILQGKDEADTFIRDHEKKNENTSGSANP